MKTFVSAGLALCFAAIVIGCSEKAEENLVPSVVTNYEAPVKTAAAEVPEGTLAAKPAEEASPNLDEVAPESETAVTCMAKAGDVLYVGGAAGVTALTDGKPERVVEGESVALLAAGDKLWVVQAGMLSTLDGATQIVPEFAARLTSAAATDLGLFVGSAGEGVFKLADSCLEPASPDWDVIALAATDFGLFAATTDGLFSFDGERWHRRTPVDSQSAPTALFYRYPYLYVGGDNQLLRYDGGRWEQFGLENGMVVSALGWHDARLYIGGDDGSLATLEGNLLQPVPDPGAGPVHALLRSDGRLHLATEAGLLQQRYGRFIEIELEEPVKHEPETEPIASLL
jgi:hypothetical protein